MIDMQEFTKGSFPLMSYKGCLCITVNGGATFKKCGKKKLPAERGGRDDRGNKLKTQ